MSEVTIILARDESGAIYLEQCIGQLPPGVNVTVLLREYDDESILNTPPAAWSTDGQHRHGGRPAMSADPDAA